MSASFSRFGCFVLRASFSKLLSLDSMIRISIRISTRRTNMSVLLVLMLMPPVFLLNLLTHVACAFAYAYVYAARLCASENQASDIHAMIG